MFRQRATALLVLRKRTRRRSPITTLRLQHPLRRRTVNVLGALPQAQRMYHLHAKSCWKATRIGLRRHLRSTIGEGHTPSTCIAEVLRSGRNKWVPSWRSGGSAFFLAPPSGVSQEKRALITPSSLPRVPRIPDPVEWKRESKLNRGCHL